MPNATLSVDNGKQGIIMKLSKSFKPLALAAIAMAGLLSTAQAALINGTIDFAGSAQFDTTSLATATQVTHFFDVSQNIDKANVVTTSGDFNLVLGGDADFAHPYIFNPSTDTNPLWTVTVGGQTFSFHLETSSIHMQVASALVIDGTGILSGNGFEDTPGSWSFSSQSSGGIERARFSFSANNSALVPDAGSALSLLGIGLIGVEVIRRKLAKA